MNIFYKVKKVNVLGRLQADPSLVLKSRLPESLTPAKSETYIGRSPTSNMEIFVKIVNSRSEYVLEESYNIFEFFVLRYKTSRLKTNPDFKKKNSNDIYKRS